MIEFPSTFLPKSHGIEPIELGSVPHEVFIVPTGHHEQIGL